MTRRTLGNRFYNTIWTSAVVSAGPKSDQCGSEIRPVWLGVGVTSDQQGRNLGSNPKLSPTIPPKLVGRKSIQCVEIDFTFGSTVQVNTNTRFNHLGSLLCATLRSSLVSTKAPLMNPLPYLTERMKLGGCGRDRVKCGR
jgi:hypothetical protein